VGAVVAGFFFGGPLADYAGRRVGMAVGSVLVIIATFMQCFAPRGNIGCFIGGRVIIGFGQGLALSKSPFFDEKYNTDLYQLLVPFTLENSHLQRFVE
jgi:MFS family permease